MLLEQELEVLGHAATLPEDKHARPAEQPPPELMQQLHKAAAALSTGRAEQMRADVFRPSHHLPTVTLAQQASHAFHIHGATVLSQLLYAVHGIGNPGPMCELHLSICLTPFWSSCTVHLGQGIEESTNVSLGMTAIFGP